MRRASAVLLALGVWLAAGAPAPTVRAQQPADDALINKARAIHDKVIALDTHDDINPENFTAERNYTQRLDTQVNLPKMVEGGLDAIFMVVYVGQPSLPSTPDAFEPSGYDRAYKSAIEKFEAVHRLTETIAPDKIGLALTAADVRRIAASGRKVAAISSRMAPMSTSRMVSGGPPDSVVESRNRSSTRRLSWRASRWSTVSDSSRRAADAPSPSISNDSACPLIDASGVRSSWETLATSSRLAASADSASRVRASSSATVVAS